MTAVRRDAPESAAAEDTEAPPASQVFNHQNLPASISTNPLSRFTEGYQAVLGLQGLLSHAHPPGMFQLIVGLGNPGRQYEDTRHNIGFMLLDHLAAHTGAVFQSVPKWQSHLAKIPGDGTILLKPQTFMNLSGRALQQILSFHKWSPENILVVYDDVSLPLGTLRFREKGSAGGHNGIKSILQHLHTDAFPRLKIGIGGSQPGEMVGHVLGKFAPDERPALENTLATALQAVQLARSQGLAAAANRFHTLTKPTPADEPQVPRSDHPQS